MERKGPLGELPTLPPRCVHGALRMRLQELEPAPYGERIVVDAFATRGCVQVRPDAPCSIR